MSIEDFSTWFDSDEERERKSLRGIRGLTLSVEVDAPDEFPVGEVDLEVLAAARLGGNGILVVASEDWEPDSVVLSVSVTAVDPDDGEQLGFVSEVSVIQSCVLVRDRTLRLAAKTWTDAGFSVATRSAVAETVVRVVGARIDRFIGAFLSAQNESTDN